MQDIHWHAEEPGFVSRRETVLEKCLENHLFKRGLALCQSHFLVGDPLHDDLFFRCFHVLRSSGEPLPILVRKGGSPTELECSFVRIGQW